LVKEIRTGKLRVREFFTYNKFLGEKGETKRREELEKGKLVEPCNQPI